MQRGAGEALQAGRVGRHVLAMIATGWRGLLNFATALGMVPAGVHGEENGAYLLPRHLPAWHVHRP